MSKVKPGDKVEIHPGGLVTTEDGEAVGLIFAGSLPKPALSIVESGTITVKRGHISVNTKTPGEMLDEEHVPAFLLPDFKEDHLRILFTPLIERHGIPEGEHTFTIGLQINGGAIRSLRI